MLVIGLSGCKPSGSVHGKENSGATRAEPESAEGQSSSVMTDSVNYMVERAVRYTLYDLSQRPPVAVGGAMVRMLGTGGEKGCCISLPAAWRPGMKVRVDWDEADREVIFPEKHSKELEIPRYDAPADLYVIFYPGHQVEVVASVGEPGHPLWAGKIKATPWDNCLARNERKVCKAALPKQFDAEGQRGYCHRAKANGWPDFELHCSFLLQQCIQDYEDENLCRETLWHEGKN